MSSCKRIIARLDVKGKRLIKGIRFEGLRVIGDACTAAEEYAKNGIDEIFYTDAVASLYGRNGLVDVLRDTTKKVFVPITAGGAISSVEDGRKLLAAGADKLAINTAAVKNPDIINQLSKRFGKQCIVLSIQVCFNNASKWEVMIEAGRERTSKDLFEWIKEGQDRGAGEIFLTSVDRDGTGNGPDLDLIKSVKELVDVPLVFGGGISSIGEISEVFRVNSNLSGLSIGWGLHYKKIDLKDAKQQLKLSKGAFREIKNDWKINKIKENAMVSIIDYGMGNTQSLVNAFELLGINSLLTKDIQAINDSNICILPGVGAFPEGIKQLKNLGLYEFLKGYSLSGKCLLGICLGMQLLLEKGTEYEDCEGLGIIPGIIKKLPEISSKGVKTIIPHVGWNKINFSNRSENNLISKNDGIFQYFVHSYALLHTEENKKNTIFTTEFEGYKISSMIKKRNTIGMQFHPERSGREGLNLLADIIDSLLKR